MIAVVLLMAQEVVLQDDFSRFPVGMLSEPVGQINPAIQEYHYLAHRGVPLDPWENAIVYLDAWCAGEEDGKPYVEMHMGPDNRRMEPALFAPSFVTGDAEWADLAIEASVKPLSTEHWAGLVFRYKTNRHHCVLVLEEGKRVRLATRLPIEPKYCRSGWREIATADFAYDVRSWHRLRVENEGAKIRGYVDGKLVVEGEEPELRGGKAGFTALVPARFTDFKATGDKKGVEARIAARKAAEKELQAENPRPKLWKSFETPKFGAGRNVRFGDLDGDGRIDMLFLQVVPKVDTGNFMEASCLTAVTLEGKVLWQLGKPDPRHGLLTSDTPAQIHDLDGDGKNEVFLIKDFQLQVLEGATGKVLKKTWMPAVPAAYRTVKTFEIKERPHDLNTGDSLSFFDLSGKGRRSEILLKDRYRFFWMLDADLKPLWEGSGRLGHFPYPFDADGDKREEVYIGYARWTPDGKQLWSHDEKLNDHADAVAVGNFSADPKAEPRVYSVGSDCGFLVFSIGGEKLAHQRIGHAQNMTVAKLRPDAPGLQIATINFWKNPGVLSLFDADGALLQQGEPHHHGSMILPVNWRGDGQEFLLLSGNVKEGGMLDGKLRRAVMFPDDGHPDLAAAVLDVTGDPRDEVVLWDRDRVWIYTQDRPATGSRIYAPARNSHANDSNYRAQVSLPGWR